MKSLDDYYFIDEHRYNCPFCQTRAAEFIVLEYFSFDWGDLEAVTFSVQCKACAKKSFHLSKNRDAFVFQHSGTLGGVAYSKLRLLAQEETGKKIDDLIIYSIPTSFFTLDTRIPRKIRELMQEAEGCRKSNFIVGATACIRKAIYETLEKASAAGDEYEERIKDLKNIYDHVHPDYIDHLAAVQDISCNNLHEDSSTSWDKKTIDYLIELTKIILNEIYVTPAERNENSKTLQELRKKFKKS